MKNIASRLLQMAGLSRCRAACAILAATLMLSCFAFATPAAAVDCVDPTFQTGLIEATAAYTNAAMMNARTTFEASPRSDIRGTQCLTGFLKYFDLIRAILSGINAMVILVGTLVVSILNAICDYVKNAIKNLINSALSYLCIPTLPGLNFGLGLGSPKPARQCKGIQLLTFDAGGSMPIPGAVPAFFNNLSRGIMGAGGTFRF